MMALTRPIEILFRWVPSVVLLCLVLLAVPGWSVALGAIVLQVVILAQVATQFTRLRLWNLHNWALSLSLYFPLTFCLTLVGAYAHVDGLSWFIVALLGLSLATFQTWATEPKPSFTDSSRLEWSSVAAALLVTSVINRFQFLKYGFIEGPRLPGIHPDNIGHQFIINATQLEGPGASGYLSDWSLRYHWLSFLWVGQFEHQFSLAQFTGVLFILPWLSLIGIAVGVASLTALLTSSRIARFIAPSLALAGQLPGTGVAENVNWDSTSQMASGLMLIGGLLLVLMLRRTRKFEVLATSLLFPLSFALFGTKVSAAVILLLATTGACMTRGPNDRVGPLRRLSPVLAVFMGSLAGYGYFVSGQESGGLLRLRWVGDTTTGIQQSILASLDALSITIALGSLFVLLPLLLTRRWNAPHSTYGVDAATLAVLGGLIPVFVLEPVFPNTTWFLTSALLIAIPIALSQAANTAMPGTRSSFGFAAIVSGALAVFWVLAIHVGIPIIAAQIALLVFVWVAGLVVLIRNRQESRYKRCVGIGSLTSLLLLVALVPAESVAARLGNLHQVSTSDSPALSIGEPHDPKSPSGIPEQTSSIGELKQLLPAGSEVHVPAELGIPALMWAADNQLRPFLAMPAYGSALGPQGSQGEVARRLKLVTQALTSTNNESLKELCREGVVGIVQASDRESNPQQGFHVVVLPCDGA